MNGKKEVKINDLNVFRLLVKIYLPLQACMIHGVTGKKLCIHVQYRRRNQMNLYNKFIHVCQLFYQKKMKTHGLVSHLIMNSKLKNLFEIWTTIIYHLILLVIM